jgi:hypothetical protein
MITVFQRNDTDGAVCCVAALLGMTYNDVLKKMFLDWFSRKNFSVRFEELKKVLSGFRKETMEHSVFNRDLNLTGIVEVSYKEDGQTKWHYIVYDARTRQFMDPRKDPPSEYGYHRFLALA